MAFAQFYYDPALEFEKLLDESEAQDNIDVPAVAVAQPHATLPGSDGSVNSLDTQSTSSVAATQPLGKPVKGKVSEPPPRPPSPVARSGSSGGGTPVPVLLSGLFKRRASTGSADDRVAKPMPGCR